MIARHLATELGAELVTVDWRGSAFEGGYASLDDAAYENLVARCAEALPPADLYHLHHLTPLNEAARRIAPDTPVIAHLHGTELLMLESTDSEAWIERMRRWAEQAAAVIVPTRTAAERAEALLGVETTLIPNGYDSEHFHPQPVPHQDTVIAYVGRFTEVKRVPLLIEAYALAQPGLNTRAPLLLIGGFPGECEGEHPRDTIARTGAQDVHLTGWYPHEELPAALNAADVIVLPSVREHFGLSLVEGMACGLPGIAVDAAGPSEIVRHGETGWLVEPDDVHGLANALVEAVNRPAERRRRGVNAAVDVAERFAWRVVASGVKDLYDATILRASTPQTA